MNASPLLDIKGLVTRFGDVNVVDGVALSIARGETLGLVGESGCGKSMLALSIARLVARPGKVAAGSVLFAGQELTTLRDRALRRLRGDRIGFIFQDPMSSLNPVLSIGEQIVELLRVHRGLGRAAARVRAIELLGMVELPAAAARLDDYPHQLSGGQRQRVMIAMAIACDPDLLIADEPTTALDVTVQAQILALLRKLQRALGIAILMITHDLGVVYETADKLAVMYAGRIVETGPMRAVIDAPTHPYTRALLLSVPPLDRTLERLPTIEGSVPAPGTIVDGCRFRTRCRFAIDRCASIDPVLAPHGAGTEVACIRSDDIARCATEAA